MVVIVLFAGSADTLAVFCSEDLLAVGVAVAAADNVEPAAELFAIGSNESFVLAALEVLLLLGAFALLDVVVLLLLWPPAVVITGALWTVLTWDRGLEGGGGERAWIS